MEAQVPLPVSAYDHAYRRHDIPAQTYGNGPTHHITRATIPRHLNNDYIKRYPVFFLRWLASTRPTPQIL